MRPECKACGHLLITQSEQDYGVCERCQKLIYDDAVEMLQRELKTKPISMVRGLLR